MVYYDNNGINLEKIGSVKDNLNNFVISNAVMTPTFADIDNDGYLDFFTGNMVGTITFYRNTGNFIDGMPEYEHISNFLGGCIAGSISILSTYPLETTRTYLSLQTNKNKYKGIFDALRKIPIRQLYQGSQCSLLGFGGFSGLQYT